MSVTREKPCCQTGPTWIRDRLKDKSALAPLTGQDWQALRSCTWSRSTGLQTVRGVGPRCSRWRIRCARCSRARGIWRKPAFRMASIGATKSAFGMTSSGSLNNEISHMLPDRKILVKGGPKQYKLRPGLTGRDRMYQRLLRLHLSAERAARRPDADMWDFVMAGELRVLVARLKRPDDHDDDDGEQR